jgi:putative ABC transport system permease protein
MSMGFNAPSWIEAIASLLLVAVSAAVAYRQRLGLTREPLVAAMRAGVHLVAVGAVLGLIFAHGGPASGFLWGIVMVVIAGHVAGRRGRGLRRLREDAEQARPAIEARLCLGLSARDAFLPHQRSALRTALRPPSIPPRSPD